MAPFNLKMVVSIAMVASMVFGSSAIQHTVGDASGWVIPDNPNLYADWTSNKIFTVGDSLVFNFPNGTHDVTKVSKDDYVHCHVSNRGSTVRSSPAIFNLNRPGSHFYICSVEGHCAFHQKLAIHVVGG
ncbi:hypothetical protein SSX86_026176 [Deinandra increscens subsp. villosa]|uniref:Phytocyanin domain-containing protein n=1 Tax=Deinandra increscens subsp. villosa TaxID=3103831 RepID=A0AAP0GMV3_9ASTR